MTMTDLAIAAGIFLLFVFFAGMCLPKEYAAVPTAVECTKVPIAPEHVIKREL